MFPTASTRQHYLHRGSINTIDACLCDANSRSEEDKQSLWFHKESSRISSCINSKETSKLVVNPDQFTLTRHLSKNWCTTQSSAIIPYRELGMGHIEKYHDAQPITFSFLKLDALRGTRSFSNQENFRETKRPRHDQTTVLIDGTHLCRALLSPKSNSWPMAVATRYYYRLKRFCLKSATSMSTLTTIMIMDTEPRTTRS